MYEKILIPLDGSKTGEAAIPYVEKLLPKLSPEVTVEVTLLHVTSSSPPYQVLGVGDLGGGGAIVYTKEQQEQLKKESIVYLNKVADDLRNKGIEVKVKLSTGDAPQEIHKTAEEIDADLITMATHGRSGLSRWAFGSTTDRVLRTETKIPVLIIKSRE